MKIEEYLETLTPEEREQHKDLIKECLDRQRTIEESRRMTNDALKKLEVLEQRLYGSLQNLAETVVIMKEELQKAYEKIGQQKKKSLDEQLRTLKPDEFYKA